MPRFIDYIMLCKHADAKVNYNCQFTNINLQMMPCLNNQIVFTILFSVKKLDKYCQKNRHLREKGK